MIAEAQEVEVILGETLEETLEEGEILETLEEGEIQEETLGARTREAAASLERNLMSLMEIEPR